VSEDIYEGPGITITRYVGPADEGPDRRRWQVTIFGPDVAHTVLDAADVKDLLHALGASALSPPRAAR
jgi:hypothetical protein